MIIECVHCTVLCVVYEMIDIYVHEIIAST